MIQTADKKQAQRGSGLPRVIQTVTGKGDSSSLKCVAWVLPFTGTQRELEEEGKASGKR